MTPAGLCIFLRLGTSLMHSKFSFADEDMVQNQSHRELEDEADAIYLLAAKEARSKAREAFKAGRLRYLDCPDDLWDSDPEGPPAGWRGKQKASGLPNAPSRSQPPAAPSAKTSGSNPSGPKQKSNRNNSSSNQ